MLPSLDIKNYRILRDLELKDLGRVNLIAGKNNTGKSSVLEAVWLLVNEFNLNEVWNLLSTRGETIESDVNDSAAIQSRRLAFASMFLGRQIELNSQNKLTIQSPNKQIEARFVKYTTISREISTEDGKGRFLRTAITDDKSDYSIGIEILKDGETSIENPFSLERISSFLAEAKKGVQFITTSNGLSPNTNGHLWDKIALTAKEEKLIDALKIITPELQKLTFKGEDTLKEARQPFVKLKSLDTPVPLKSMGDGINRILTIILSLVNAENGYLLIDEFENGLHHSIQEDLWKMIFQLAAELNVQVFATTHSYDCIRAFSKVALDDKNQDGKLIRLDNVKGEIKPTYYTEEELRFATEHNIEVR